MRQADWKPLCRVGAMAGIVVLALVPLQLAVFVARPPPSTVLGWFALFDESPILGLVSLDFLLLVDMVLIGILFLALASALWDTSRASMAVALVFQILAMATLFASNPAFEMWSLAGRYAAAINEAEKLTLVGAGEAMMASWQGSAFVVSYILGALAILVSSIVMFRNALFRGAPAWVGLVFGLLSLIPASAGTPGLVASIASLVPMCIWFGLIALRLFRLGRIGGAQTSPMS